MSTNSELFLTLVDGKWLIGSRDIWLKVTVWKIEYFKNCIENVFMSP